MNRLAFTPHGPQVGMRVDAAIALGPAGLTRAQAQRLIQMGAVTVNGAPAVKGRPLCEGDAVVLEIPDPTPLCVGAEDIPLDVVYEDDWLLVVNKPRGMVVHPAPGHGEGTLVNALLHHCRGGLSGIGGVMRPGIVHRIDKDTSGLLLVAKNDAAHQSLAAQIAAHTLLREYRAVVHGGFRDSGGTVDAPIGRSPLDRKKMAVAVRNAREAVTHYEVVARYEGFTQLCCRLETGRTHQIRVHMAYIGHPVAGDPAYGPKGGKSPPGGGQCLHAKTLGFTHPATGERVVLDSALPAYFTAFLGRLRPLA